LRDRLFQNGNLTIEEVAREEDLVPSYVTRLLRLTLPAPDIITSIIAGRQPPELTARKLMADTRLPRDGASSGSSWIQPGLIFSSRLETQPPARSGVFSCARAEWIGSYPGPAETAAPPKWRWETPAAERASSRSNRL
jgi:hypothetical protein